MYCKFLFSSLSQALNFVLIVAKCIVNNEGLNGDTGAVIVLIVAKCIVNFYIFLYFSIYFYVLIVAKCIVNL